MVNQNREVVNTMAKCGGGSKSGAGSTKKKNGKKKR